MTCEHPSRGGTQTQIATNKLLLHNSLKEEQEVQEEKTDIQHVS